MVLVSDPEDQEPFQKRIDYLEAQWAGFKSRKTGGLLRAAEAAGYNVLAAVDHGLPHLTALRGFRRHRMPVSDRNTRFLYGP